MKRYTAHLRHDNGRVKITVLADNVDDAKRRVMKLEGCPLGAIEFCGRTPTKKGIEQLMDIR
jgi:hypothetical protein